MSLINGLQNKSALHRRPFRQFRTDPQPLREFHAQEMQKGRLGRLATYHAPQAHSSLPPTPWAHPLRGMQLRWDPLAQLPSFL